MEPATRPEPIAADEATPAIDEYRFGPFRMDVASMQLWRGETPVPLPPKAFDTLRVLIANRHRLVTKDELLNAVWPNSFVSEESVHQNITSLRRALGDDHSQPTYIATVARRGYRFVGTAEPRFSSGPADRLPAAVAPQAPPPIQAPTDATTPGLTTEEQTAPDIGLQAAYRWRLIASGAGAVAVVAVTVLAVNAFRPAAAPPPLRLSVGSPGDTQFISGALSPDGAELALVAEDADSGMTRLWFKVLSPQAAGPRVVPGSEGAARPFWSADGQWVGFFANGRMKRVSVGGGPVQTVTSITGPKSSGGTWGPDGTILYANYMSGVFAVSSGGGEPRSVTTLSAEYHEIAHRWPQFLPDGRHFLYSVISGDSERAGTYVGSLDSPTRTRIVASEGAIHVAPGYLVYVVDRVLMAQKFDEKALRLTGAPVTLSGDVQAPAISNNAILSASTAGLLTFTGDVNRRSHLAWLDRSGQSIAPVKTPTDLYNPSLSRDQRFLMAGTGKEIWLVDLERNAPTRIGRGNTTFFSPDGLRIAFTSGPGGGLSELYVRDTSGATESTLLLSGSENKLVTDWSRDGRYIVYCSISATTQMDVWAVPTTGEPKPIPILKTPFNECQGQLSPDGRWITYASDETETWEIYVEAFPGGGSKRVISVGGGSEPQWRGDGRELFYVASDGTLTSVQFDGDARLAVRHPVRLFRIPIKAGELNTRRNHYVASADGQRFLVSSADQERDTLGVLLNWASALQ